MKSFAPSTAAVMSWCLAASSAVAQPASEVATTDMRALCQGIDVHHMRFYPPRARDADQEGAVLLDCVISDDRLSTCRVVEENPPNWGFGDAATKIACAFTVEHEGDQPHVRGASPQTRLLRAPDGTIHAIVPVRFALQ